MTYDERSKYLPMLSEAKTEIQKGKNADMVKAGLLVEIPAEHVNNFFRDIKFLEKKD